MGGSGSKDMCQQSLLLAQVNTVVATEAVEASLPEALVAVLRSDAKGSACLEPSGKLRRGTAVAAMQKTHASDEAALEASHDRVIIVASDDAFARAHSDDG